MKYIVWICVFLCFAQLALAQTLPVLPKKTSGTNTKSKTAKPTSAKQKVIYVKKPIENIKIDSGDVTSNISKSTEFYFSDDFSDNKNSWLLISDARKEINIRNGKLLIKGIVTGIDFFTSSNFDVDVSKDFSCSVTVKWIEGIQDHAFGIDYCSDLPSHSFNEFAISANGGYRMNYYENNGEWRDLKDWTATSFINKGAIPNILLIKKEGNYLSFYINDHLIETFPYDGGFGNDFGFRVRDIQTVEFDNFELKGIKKK